LFTLSLPPGGRGEGGMMGLWISGWVNVGWGYELWLTRWFDRIQTWALEEARRRLEAEGILKEPDSKS
jgi:hypothetical protein